MRWLWRYPQRQSMAWRTGAPRSWPAAVITSCRSCWQFDKRAAKWICFAFFSTARNDCNRFTKPFWSNNFDNFALMRFAQLFRSLFIILVICSFQKCATIGQSMFRIFWNFGYFSTRQWISNVPPNLVVARAQHRQDNRNYEVQTQPTETNALNALVDSRFTNQHFTLVTTKTKLYRAKRWNLRDAGPYVEREGQGAIQDGRRSPSPGMQASRLFHENYHIYDFFLFPIDLHTLDFIKFR